MYFSCVIHKIFGRMSIALKWLGIQFFKFLPYIYYSFLSCLSPSKWDGVWNRDKALIMLFVCSLRSRVGWNCWRSDVTKIWHSLILLRTSGKFYCSFKGVSKEWAISSEERLKNSVTGNPQQKGHLLFFGLTIHKQNNQCKWILLMEMK